MDFMVSCVDSSAFLVALLSFWILPLVIYLCLGLTIQGGCGFLSNSCALNVCVWGSRDSSSSIGEMTPEEWREQQKQEEALHASSLRVPRRHVLSER